jgi:hypothetical protein
MNQPALPTPAPTLADVFEFLDHAVALGRFTPRTADAHRLALHRILGAAPGWRATPLSQIDLPARLTAFAAEHADHLAAGSIATYQRSLRAVLRQYRDYAADPDTWNRLNTGRRNRPRTPTTAHTPAPDPPAGHAAYTDAVLGILTEHLGPDALTLLTDARRHPIRALLAAHLDTAAHQASRHERDLRQHMRSLHSFLGHAQQDPRYARTPTRWEVIGTTGTALDQDAACYGQALEHLNAAALLFTQAAKHLPPPDTNAPP